jgi:Integrase core domain
VEHHPALPYDELADFVAALRSQEGIASRALEFLILTATRTGEVIGAPSTCGTGLGWHTRRVVEWDDDARSPRYTGYRFPAAIISPALWLYFRFPLGLCMVDERFHRTLTAEVIGRRAFADLAECQQLFDAWRVVYNTQRPHEALDLATPAARYRPSGRGFPEKIAPFDYGPAAIVRRVDGDGWLSFRNRPIKLGRAFSYRRVALRATDQDSCFDVLFSAHKVGALDLRAAAP